MRVQGWVAFAVRPCVSGVTVVLRKGDDGVEKNEVRALGFPRVEEPAADPCAPGGARNSHADGDQEFAFGANTEVQPSPAPTTRSGSGWSRAPLSYDHPTTPRPSHLQFHAAPDYLPSKRVLKEGGYEGGGAMKYMSYPYPGPFAETVEDRVAGKAKALAGGREARGEVSPRSWPSASVPRAARRETDVLVRPSRVVAEDHDPRRRVTRPSRTRGAPRRWGTNPCRPSG